MGLTITYFIIANLQYFIIIDNSFNSLAPA